MDTEYGRAALMDNALYQEIINHRRKFYHVGVVDYMVTLWRKGLVRSGVIQNDPNLIQIDPNIVEQVYQLIVKDHSISRARK